MGQAYLLSATKNEKSLISLNGQFAAADESLIFT